MSDDKITDPHHTLPVFINQVVGRGILNGVVNLTLATAQFTPTEDHIAPDLIISSRLRMDIACAMQLRDELNSLLEKVAEPTQPSGLTGLPAGERAN